jgi:hypothetical protein
MSRQRRLAVVAALTALALLTAAAPPAWAAAAPALVAAADAATAALAGTSFVAKVDIGNVAKFYVQADGEPVEDREQKQSGYGRNTLWAPGGPVLVRAGEVGQVIFVQTKYPGRRARENEYWVFLNRKRRVNAAGVAVVFDRPVRPEDITPEKVARAVASLVTIRGYEPGADVAAAFDQALAAAPAEATAAGSSASAAAPMLVALRLGTEPAEVARGGEVSLRLEYELAGVAAEREVVERVSLLHGERPLPGYPIEARPLRGGGVHQASYAQRIPAAAAPGTYTVRGEVCVAGDCIVRSATFEVR